MNWLINAWWLLVLACVVWYSTVTVYVAVRGAVDIRHLLAKLKEDDVDSSSANT